VGTPKAVPKGAAFFLLKWVRKKKDRFDTWLESDVDEAPTYLGMTDDELTTAICRAAIREGHDPAEHGVVPSAIVMEEEDSQELAYKNQLKANLVMEFSTHFGVSQRQARRDLVATGTIPLGEDASTMEQALVDTTLADEGVKYAALEQLSTSTCALTVPSDDANLQVFLAFIRKVEHYDTWLRPFAVFMCSLLFAGAAGLSAPTTLVLMIMAYGFTCHDFKPKQKAIEAVPDDREKSEPPVDADGAKRWYRDGKLHREDGPAIEWASGTKEWCRDDKLHREDGPAVVHADGDKRWYRDGKLHREDGPAVEWANGTKRWYRDGKRHREDGPAIEYASGTKEWYRDGKLHREDGPAVVHANGTKYWYRDGVFIREERD